LPLRTPSSFHRYCRSFAAGISAPVFENITTSLSRNFSTTIARHITAPLIFDRQLPLALQHNFREDGSQFAAILPQLFHEFATTFHKFAAHLPRVYHTFTMSLPRVYHCIAANLP
jgi:hypothetical protein